MNDVEFDLAELLLNGLGLVGVILATMALGYVGFSALGRLIWRLRKQNVNSCAGQIATGLSLSVAPPPDPRMSFWRGHDHRAEYWLATGALCQGPIDSVLYYAGPGFIDGAPRLTFEYLNSLLLVARFNKPMPYAFTASTMYAVPASLRTGDMRFDGKYSLCGEHADAVTQLFADAPLRDALMALFGRDGTGIVVCVNEFGLTANWSSPESKRCDDFAMAVPGVMERFELRSQQ
jgi:hypothetical protein